MDKKYLATLALILETKEYTIGTKKILMNTINVTDSLVKKLSLYQIGLLVSADNELDKEHDPVSFAKENAAPYGRSSYTMSCLSNSILIVFTYKSNTILVSKLLSAY